MRRLLLFTAVLMCLMASLYAADEPELKEGLRTIHTQTIDQPGNKKAEGTRSICRNHAYDERVRAMAKKQNCKTISESSSGKTKTTETECTIGSTVTRTKGTYSFSGDTAAHSETHGTYTPPLYGVSETTIIMDEKYVGACPAGMQPGDMMNADGKIIHRQQQ